jgi:hypothetical protein
MFGSNMLREAKRSIRHTDDFQANFLIFVTIFGVIGMLSVFPDVELFLNHPLGNLFIVLYAISIIPINQ